MTSPSRFDLGTERVAHLFVPIGYFNLAAGMGAWWIGHSDNLIVYLLAGVTFLAGLLLSLRWLIGRGVRSAEQLGFSSFGEAIHYDWLDRGIRPKFWLMGGCVFAYLFLIMGRRELSGAAVLGLATFWMTYVGAHVTQLWPADRDRP